MAGLAGRVGIIVVVYESLGVGSDTGERLNSWNAPCLGDESNTEEALASYEMAFLIGRFPNDPQTLPPA